jgi:hypothetical protein
MYHRRTKKKTALSSRDSTSVRRMCPTQSCLLAIDRNLSLPSSAVVIVTVILYNAQTSKNPNNRLYVYLLISYHRKKPPRQNHPIRLLQCSFVATTTTRSLRSSRHQPQPTRLQAKSCLAPSISTSAGPKQPSPSDECLLDPSRRMAQTGDYWVDKTDAISEPLASRITSRACMLDVTVRRSTHPRKLCSHYRPGWSDPKR